MKKLLLSAFLVAALGPSISSCNNGPYDADPKKNEGTYLNPLNPASGVTIPIGYMTMDINGYFASFLAGVWSDSTTGVASLVAYRFDTATQWQTVYIAITSYNGPGTYNFLPDGSNGVVIHQIFNPYDTGYIASSHASNVGAGNATVNVQGTEDGNIRGTFSAKLYRVLPNVNTNDSDIITNGKFYLPKL
ncbi:MAG TPA: hypothetical protein VEB40_01520 [Flavipsychrobacter sp.]|nr:hypothetical protein [Flavipsychrobacter sp.]